MVNLRLSVIRWLPAFSMVRSLWLLLRRLVPSTIIHSSQEHTLRGGGVIRLLFVQILLLHLHVRKFGYSLSLWIIRRSAFKSVLTLLLAFGISKVAGLPITSCVLSLGKVGYSLVLIGASWWHCCCRSRDWTLILRTVKSNSIEAARPSFFWNHHRGCFWNWWLGRV